MKKTFLLLISLSFSAISFAQQHKCHTDEYEALLIKKNPELQLEKEKLEKEYGSLENKPQPQYKKSAANIKYVPVVFHVVYRTSYQNITDAKIMEQLNRLNEDYSGTNADTSTVPSEFKPFIADTEIRFYLANTDPDGNPTTGITRTETDAISFSVGGDEIKYDAQGGIDAWSPTEYLNFWVGNIEAGILGYATPPFNHGNSSDGIVVGYQYVGNGSATSAYNLGRTAVHEVGHYFGLSHIWGNGGGCFNDDGISDTPMQESSHYGQPNHPSASCGSNDMFMNYMDYCDDEVLVMFSEGQKTRMLHIANTTRSSLVTSQPVGVEEESEVVFNVYPNPSSGVFNVSLKETSEQVLINVLDITGKSHFTKQSENTNKIEINVSNLTNGIYFVQVINGASVSQQKIVIRK